jgi:transposase
MSGLHVNDFLADESFNADYIVRNVLTPIYILPIVAVTHEQKKQFIININNSQMHKSKIAKEKLSKIPIHVSPHPLYSPDLVPLDVFLFGYLKEKMIGFEFDFADDLLDWIKAEFESITDAVLEVIFESWINRVEKCIQYEGDYFPKHQIIAKAIMPQITRNGRC